MKNPPIEVPEDRTLREPVVAFCRNPECAVDQKPFTFRVEHDRQACPKCGADRSPMVGLTVLTHLLVPDPKGPIRGQGRMWKLCCEQDRAYLATATNQEAATDNANLFNCHGCQKAARKMNIQTPELVTA